MASVGSNWTGSGNRGDRFIRSSGSGDRDVRSGRYVRKREEEEEDEAFEGEPLECSVRR